MSRRALGIHSRLCDKHKSLAKLCRQAVKDDNFELAARFGETMDRTFNRSLRVYGIAEELGKMDLR